MDYRQAVMTALQGDGSGFAWLYEATQHDMYYIALKYMKNEDDAMDVLQDSYMKAWQSLASLKEPENFRAWFGRIVANTAKNALVKKRPTLFSQMDTENGDGDAFEFDIEDDRKEYQPERSYTEKETQLLVRELIDSLSDEQRLCIMMYHFDGQSIKDIAEAFGVSENTVKSRLLYGRKAIKSKAEELQKKGYQLYSFAPLPLLLFLLRSERKSPEFSAAALAVKNMQRETIFESANLYTHGTARSTAHGTVRSKVQGAAHGTARAVKTSKHGFIHTIAGKITIGVLSVAAVAGVSATTTHFVLEYMDRQEAAAESLAENGENNEIAETSMTETVPEETTMPETEAPETEPPETEPPVKEVADAEYPTLLAGGLTKSELNLILTYGPDEIGEGGLSDADLFYWFPLICMGDEQEGNLISSFTMNADYTYGCTIDEANRFISVLTDTRFSESNATAALWVNGGRLNFYGVTLSYGADTTIHSAKYTEDAMVIQYTHTTTYYNDGGRTETAEKEALLKPNAEGKFKIVRIYNADNKPAEVEGVFENTKGNAGKQPVARDDSLYDVDGESNYMYTSVLEKVANDDIGYNFPSYEETVAGELEYTIYDMDGDGKKELIIRDRLDIPQPFNYYVYQVYTKEVSDDGKSTSIVSADGIMESLAWLIPEDGIGVYDYQYSRGNGDEDYYRITLEDGALKKSSRPELSATLGSGESEEFSSKLSEFEWYGVSDMSWFEERIER